MWSVQENRNAALENLKKRRKKNPTKKQTVSAQKVQNTSLVPFIASACNGLQLHYFFLTLCFISEGLDSDCLWGFFSGKTTWVHLLFFGAHLINGAVSGKQMGFSLVRGVTAG